MNEAHWHLAVNHLPIILPIAGLIVLICSLIFKSDAVRKSAYVLLIIAALTAAVSMKTGEEAEELVEHMAGIEHSMIHEHEEAAEGFAVLMYILGVVSIVGIWAEVKKATWGKWVIYLVLVLSVVAIYMARITGTTGGEVRHTEIRAGFAPQAEADEHEENE
ncbi:hypothetical protein KIH23_12880 [Flavobacterium sp. CYK-55]|uniref:hypothetical protein n=1 Tax=Flavobacterium sp. CYK-55 TaxID=2835529 RepID=UPI001BCD804D|nr:hypothetical protein [Flavobacterium sp. CYK-55]MBS7788194.1 hypothetical protein [Flavobacterium sp. CYK-55]